MAFHAVRASHRCDANLPKPQIGSLAAHTKTASTSIGLAIAAHSHSDRLEMESSFRMNAFHFPIFGLENMCVCTRNGSGASQRIACDRVVFIFIFRFVYFPCVLLLKRRILCDATKLLTECVHAENKLSALWSVRCDKKSKHLRYSSNYMRVLKIYGSTLHRK